MLAMTQEPKRGRGRPPGRQGVSLHVRISAEMKAALDALSDRNRRPLTTEVEIALEAHLKEAGLWPWPPPEDQSEPEGQN